MALFNWCNQYSINNEEIDTHHKHLFNLFNKLYDGHLAQGNSITLDHIIEELISYTSYHFSAEEQIMIDIGFKGIHKHRMEHDSFKEKIYQLRHRNYFNDTEVEKELIVFLGNWLRNHVIVEDKKISTYTERSG
jgi:hemerythrin-like metal-binding protein